jgi:hypothetical protein
MRAEMIVRVLSIIAVIGSLGGLVGAADVGVPLTAPATVRPTTNHLTDFDIHRCEQNKTDSCLRAKGAYAFVSLSGDSMSAQDATLEIDQAKHKAKYTCALLRFDLIDQFLICDNRDLARVPSLTVDSHFIVRNY